MGTESETLSGMHRISATEASRSFSRLLDEIERGTGSWFDGAERTSASWPRPRPPAGGPPSVCAYSAADRPSFWTETSATTCWRSWPASRSNIGNRGTADRFDGCHPRGAAWPDTSGSHQRIAGTIRGYAPGGIGDECGGAVPRMPARGHAIEARSTRGVRRSADFGGAGHSHNAHGGACLWGDRRNAESCGPENSNVGSSHRRDCVVPRR